MTTATRQRTRAPHRYTPPLSVRTTRASHTNGGLYAYAANSPVCYTDPDGMEITVEGNRQYRQLVGDYLRHLAPGASIDLKTGKVSFDKTVCQGRFIKGSELIEKLVNDGSVTIRKGTAFDGVKNQTKAEPGGAICITFTPDTRRDVPTVLFDKNGRHLVIEMANPVMMLGHELIHAMHHVGETIDKTPVGFYINLFGVAGQATTIDKEELRTTGMPGYYGAEDITENMLRGEQLLLLRADYD